METKQIEQLKKRMEEEIAYIDRKILKGRNVSVNFPILTDELRYLHSLIREKKVCRRCGEEVFGLPENYVCPNCNEMI